MKRNEIANAVTALAKRHGLTHAAQSEIVTLIEAAIGVEVEKAAERARDTLMQDGQPTAAMVVWGVTRSYLE